MPFVIVNRPRDTSKTVQAIMCEANLLGQPDRRSRVPVLIRQISERTLLVDPDDAPEIVSLVMRDGVTTYAVGPGRKRRRI